MPDTLTEDIAAASAAVTFNTLPDLLRLSDSEVIERLRSHFEGALMAYRHFTGMDPADETPRVPEPTLR